MIYKSLRSHRVQFWITAALIVVVLGLYTGFPTKNYYWDGVSFALTIEDAKGLSPSLLHPNHLIYNGIGYLVWVCVRRLAGDIRAIVVLQGLSIVAAIVCVWVLHRLILRITNSVYVATSLSALFAFSSTWWKFATDADTYILGTLALTVAAYLLYASKRPRPVLVAFVHACGMLVHQLAAIFFVPAALYIHRKYGFRSLFVYSATAGVITFSSYYVGFWLSQDNWNPHSFLWWVTSHSADVAFDFDLVKNARATAISYVRLFLGGQLSLFWQFFGLFPFGVLAGLIIVVVMLLVLSWRGWKDFRLFEWYGERDEAARFPIVWVSTYALFLFFWLPHNTFYKLFCLPGIILIMAQSLVKYVGPGRNRVAFFTAAVALANLAFSVFPYSHAEANQPLSFALGMQGQWSDRTVVYYASFTTDNCLIRYFNPATTWRQMKSRDLAGFQGEAMQDIQSGREVWIDTTAADILASDGGGHDSHYKTVRELVNPRHRIRFMLWSPHAKIVNGGGSVR